MVFAEYAQRYFEMGYIPLPIDPSTKRCLVSNWNSIFTRDLTQDRLDEFVESHGHWDIGIVCGTASGIVGVDFDWDADHAEILEDMCLGVLPISPVAKKGNKGWTRFYRLVDGIQLWHIKRVSEGKEINFVDILADGPGYTVMPPSACKSGQYRFLTDDTLFDTSANELPDLTLDHVEAIRSIAAFSNEEIHYNSNNKGSRNDRNFGRAAFLFRSCRDLGLVTEKILAYDRLTHAQDPKGPYYDDKKYIKRMTPEAACLKDVKKWFKYMEPKLPPIKKAPPGQPQKPPLSLSCTEKGVPYSNVDNVAKILNYDAKYSGHIWFDTFHQKIFTDKDGTRTEWTDACDTELTIRIQSLWGIPVISTHTVTEAVVFYAKSNRRNEPQDWIKSLVWDGQSRIDSFMTFGLGVKVSDYSRAASKNFFIALAARIMEPGCKVDNMIVLEGSQGKFKSTALKIIGDPWFMESSDTMGGKAFAETLDGKLLCEIAELDSFSKADSRQVKRTITTRVDRRRVPFERHAGDFPRITIFVGTTNEDEYLEDPTGGRRFWPMKVGEVDLKFVSANRDQLFAEALVRYQAGESWWEMPQSAEDQQGQRRRKDAWEDTILNWTERVRNKVSAEGYTLVSIASSALTIDAAKFSVGDSRRLASCLRVCGWSKQHTKVGNIWVLGEPSNEERGAESAPDFVPRVVNQYRE